MRRLENPSYHNASELTQDNATRSSYIKRSREYARIHRERDFQRIPIRLQATY